MNKKGRENYAEPKEKEFNVYLLEMFALAHQVDETKTIAPDLQEFIEEQPIDSGCRQAAASIRKQN